MNATPADIIAAARMAVYVRHPYLAFTLFAMRVCPAPGLGTLAVDEHWRLFYDPETVVEWHQEMLAGQMDYVGGARRGHDGVAAVVYHELGHVLRQHHQRRGDRDAQAWNRAADREINDDLPEASWVLPGCPLLPRNIGMKDGLTAEEYYVFPAGPKPLWPYLGDGPPGSGGDCGGCAGNPTEWEKQNAEKEVVPGGDPGSLAPGAGSAPAPLIPSPVEPHEQEVVLRRTALDIQSHARSRGVIPASLLAWANAKLTPPKIDWRKQLAALVRCALAAVSGASDWTWRKPGRRSLHAAGRAGWPLAPALHQPVPKVGVVLDTSGSMSCGGKDGRTVLEEALSEVVGIARAAGADVWVAACDADVQAIARVRGEKDLEKVNKGGGGTIMTPGFLAMKKKRPDVVLIVTDGIVGDGWPDAVQCRGVRTLAVLVGESGDRPPEHIRFVEAL